LAAAAHAAGPAAAEPVGTSSAPTAVYGQLITDIELRSDAPLASLPPVGPLLAIEVGRPLAAADVRRTLRNLWATGEFANLVVVAEPAPGGVVIAVALYRNVWVESVDITGELGLRPAQLRSAIPQLRSEPLIEDRLLRGVYRLQDLYREQGYLHARVRLDVRVDDASKTAKVVYAVDSGPQATIASVGFRGELGPYPAAALLARLSVKPGRRYVAAEARSDADRLRQWLVREDRRLAVVEAPVEAVEAPAESSPGPAARAPSDRVDLLYTVRVGPKVTADIRGVDRKLLVKQDLLPFLGDEGYDEALVLQAAEKIRQYFQAKGHYQVRVDWHEEKSEDAVRVVLDIAPGAVFAVRQLAFRGNEELTDRDLLPLLATGERRALVPGSGRLVDAVLAADLSNLRSYYALQGFRDARVGPPEVVTSDIRHGLGKTTGEGDLVITIPITEGERRRVVSVDLTGAAALSASELLNGLPLHAGGPYHPRLLDDSLALLRARYGEQGYDEVQIDADTAWNADRSLADVHIRVLEGRRAEADRVIVRGNDRTRTGVITQAVALPPGTTLTTERLLDVQRRLYDLGVFSRVAVDVERDAPFAAERNVIVRVEEGRSRRVNYGLGYDSDDGARGLLLLTHSNLFGRAMTAQLDVRASQRNQQALVLFRQPSLGSWPVPVTYSVYYQEEDTSRFVGDIRGTRVEATRLFRGLRFDLLYNYRIVDGLAGAGSADDRQLSNVATSSLTPSIFVDRRDDPVEPRRGWSQLLQLEYASPLLSADAEFGKFFVQQTFHLPFRPLTRGTNALGHGLAASLRFGAIEDFSGQTSTRELSNPVPAVERFFAGGRSTQRAFGRDDLGVPGETLDGDQGTGGNGLVLVNVDYRFPIIGQFGGVVFFDWGNVWADWRHIDLGEARPGAGVGVRYLSPIGPLRVEIGWKLDRQHGESPYAVFVSLGNPF
jgi:outer membrane protein insertion porin family